MKIRMLASVTGSPDGMSTVRYESDREYDLPDTPRGLDLALVMLAEGWAEDVEAKAVTAAPENKAVQAAPENKGQPSGRRQR